MYSARAKAAALVQRLVPAARLWRNVGDDVTFNAHGFVAADDPPSLLARQNYESEEIRRTLGDRYLHSLEIGCGFGRLSMHFAASSVKHTAVDINADALATARRHYPNFDYRTASAVELPFADDTFDLITTWTVLQHIRPDRIDMAMAEIDRVATREATLLLCEESAQAATVQPERWHTHTWHRLPSFYADRLPGFTVLDVRQIEGLVRAGIGSPGTIIVLKGGEQSSPSPVLGVESP